MIRRVVMSRRKAISGTDSPSAGQSPDGLRLRDPDHPAGRDRAGRLFLDLATRVNRVCGSRRQSPGRGRVDPAALVRCRDRALRRKPRLATDLSERLSAPGRCAAALELLEGLAALDPAHSAPEGREGPLEGVAGRPHEVESGKILSDSSPRRYLPAALELLASRLREAGVPVR